MLERLRFSLTLLKFYWSNQGVIRQHFQEIIFPIGKRSKGKILERGFVLLLLSENNWGLRGGLKPPLFKIPPLPLGKGKGIKGMGLIKFCSIRFEQNRGL